MQATRAIEPMPLPDLVPNADIGAVPRIEWVAPESLHVEEAYQRDLSRRSVNLIATIVAEWNWVKFKPPVCVDTEDGRRVVIEGQHTAIAAASHTAISEIPVIISAGVSLSDRARAFVAHNRNRLAITGYQMHRAAVAAGDDVALAVEDGCRLAGVTLLANTRPRGEWRSGETIAIKGLERVGREKGKAGVARVLRILVRARHQPITAKMIATVYMLLYAPEWAVREDEKLADVLARRSADGWDRLAAPDGERCSARDIAVCVFRHLQGTR